MDSWLTYSDFKEKYPDSSLTEPQFTPMAIDAALFIENATRWCASIAAEPEQTELLALCQARLVALSEEVSASWDGVTSVSNHGYTESYASGMDMRSYLGTRQQQIVEQTLSAPVTRWMLYQGGVYRPADAEGRPTDAKTSRRRPDCHHHSHHPQGHCEQELHHSTVRCQLS